MPLVDSNSTDSLIFDINAGKLPFKFIWVIEIAIMYSSCPKKI